MIFIALGSNLGDRAANLARAQELMAEININTLRASSVIETPALLMPGAPEAWNIAYLNQVLQVETEFMPETLLVQLKRIEQRMGRVDHGRWGPREIDLDIIAYNDMVLATGTLTLPHPQLHMRDFVLKPLLEIAPEWQHPTLKHTPEQMLAVL